MSAIIAVDLSGARCGYVVQYREGFALHGEYDDPLTFLNVIEGLLQNGLPWKVLLATPAAEAASGALWYLAAKHGACFAEVPLPDLTDGHLRQENLWRRGMSAANRAARLILLERGDA